METRQSLEKRVKQLESQVAALGAGRMRGYGVRKRSGFEIANLPLYDIALGPDLERGEIRGHARGIIAIGDIATGVVAMGGLARGVVALGGLAVGLFGFGGLSIGALAAFGGLAIGGLAVGGGAVGAVALGGGAAGYYYACGGSASGEYAVSATRRDPEAQAFFAEYGLESLCGGAFTGRRRR